MIKSYPSKSTFIRSLLLAIIVFSFSSLKSFGNVVVTPPSLTISTCSFPSAYIPLGNIVITEGAVGDFAASGGSKTLVLSAPANFQFQAGTGSVGFTAARDITVASVVVTAANITVTYTCPTNTKFDVLTISGIYVQAITGVAAGQTVTRSAASTGTIAGDAVGKVHATLTSVVGCATVTAPSLTISTCAFPSAYIPLGNIVITETANTDFSAGANQTLILTAPANFQFQAGTGAVSFTAARDITAASVVVTATTITVTYTVAGVVNADALTISGIYVQAITGVAAGQTVTRTGGSGVINGDVNTKVHATLTSVVGCATVTAPSLTISTCAFPSAYIPLGNIVITETANTDFSAGANQTLILTAPANFQFQAGTGAVSFTAARDITAASVVVTATTITVTYTVAGVVNADALTISGIYVQAITGVAAGQTVTRTGGSGVINGDVNTKVHATLTSVVGCATVTAPSLTITTCTFPSAYNALGNIVITETANTDFSAGANQTLILTAPANFQFQAGTGSVTFAGGGDISAATVAVTATTITVTYTAGGVVNPDALTISGIMVQAITGVAAGQTVTRTGGTGVINGDANTKVHATLTSVVSCVSITAPSLTITTCSFPSAYTPLGNIVITEASNTDFSSGANQTLILTAPANFQFQAGVGAVSFTAGKDITAASIVVTATTITVTYSVGGITNLDALTISGIMVEAITGAAAGQTVTRTGGTGVISGDVNTTVHATLTSVVSCVSITAPSLTISVCTFPSTYISLGNIVITESSNTDFSAGANQTLILTAPANFQFQTGVGTVSFTAGKDITAASIVVTATTITVTYSVGGVANADAMTISGIYVQAITGAAAGQTVTRTGGTGVISGDVNTTVHATLTSVVGCVVTAPSLTINTCSFPSAYAALGNIVITEGAVTDFSAGANQTLILTAPTNFQFQANTGFVTYTGGRNITGAAIAVTATTITITYTVVGTNALDVMTISGIYVQAITGAAAGQVVMRTGGTGVINGDINTTVHATLTSTLGTIPGSCATYTAPANGTSGVSVNGTTLTWNAVAGATGYDVYLEAGTTPPVTLVSSNQAGTSYSTGALTGSATYYWIIVPRNSCGAAVGCNTVWSFSTASSGCVTWTTQSDFGFGITTDNIDLTTSPNDIVLQTNQTQVVDQAQTAAVVGGYNVSATQWIGQTFTPSITGKLTAVDVGFFTNTTGGTCLVQIYNTTGGVPTGASIATTTLQYFGGTALYNCTFSAPACLTAGTLYALVCTAPLTGTAGAVSTCTSVCNPYPNGTMVYSLNAGASWSTFTSDCVFRTYMSTYAYSSQGTWISPIINSGASADWTTLGWNAVVPANTSVQYQVWAGNSTSGPFLYVGPNGTSATYFTLAGTGNPSLLDANVPGPNSPPYSYTYGKQYLRVKAYLNTTAPGPVGCNPGTTPTINDITVCYNIITCSAPTAQATNITFSNIASSQMLVNWTNGNGAKRILKIRRQSDPAFTTPVDGVDPVANTVYSGSGEQVVYNGAGNGVTVTGLAAYDGTANTIYCFEVWEANCVGTSVKWYLGAGVGNPNCQQTLSCTLPTVTAFSSPAELCAPGTVSLSAIGANTYTWSVFSGAGSVSPTTGTPVTGTVPSTTTYQVQGCIGVGCCSNAQVIVSVSPGVNLYPGGSLSNFQDFETSGWACSNWTNLTAARPTVTGNYWILRNSQTGTALQSCIFDWGSTPYNINANQFGNNVLNGQYSLTCEGYTSVGPALYYGYDDAVVSNSRAILTVNGTGYSGYTVTFNYQIGGDSLTGTYGAVDYSADGGTTWVLVKKFQKIFTAATATVQLPSAVANISNLMIGFRLATPGDNNNYAPTFTIDNLSVIAYPVPVNPSAPSAPTGLVVCPGNGSTLFTTSAGSTGYNWTISGASIGTTTITPNGDSATVYWDPTATGTAQVCVQSVSSCGATSATSCSTVTLSASWTWTGAQSTDWMDYRNWACGSVPNSNTSDVIIPNTTNKPHILSGETVQIRNININAASALVTIDNGGIFQVAGTMTAAASAFIDNSAGTIEFNGASAQTIPASLFVGNNCYNIIMDQSITLTSGGLINLSGVLSMSVAQTFTTNNGLTLLSSATGTAQVAAIPSGGAITGTVTVQRYYPAHRAWRLMSVPAVSVQTVQQAFMEGVYNTAISPWPASDMNPNPGYGTHISGNSPNANQFDVTNHNNPSMMTFVSGTPPNDIWAGIPNTNGTNINYKNGYMLFVRGSRAVNLPLDVSAPADVTVLRPKGTLNIGTQAAIPVAANSFAVFGNPYASAIDFHLLTKTNVIDAFDVWDPNAAGSYNVGAWVTFTWNGSTYVSAPASYTAGLGRYIQSSQAVLVQNSSASAGSVTAAEADKVSGSVTSPFTPMVQQEQFRTNVYQLNADGSTLLVDGTLTIYDNSYSAGVDNVDAWKPTNFSSETISQSNSGRSLGIEARPIIGNYDTLYYNISFYRRPYRFEFIANGLNHPGLRGYLHDNYLNTDTPLNLNDTTRVDFITNNDLASRDNTRFRAIFTTDAPLPITLRTIKAYKQNNGIQVEWTLSQEINMHHYEVERSLEGTSFSMKGTTPARGNSNTAVTYSWFDANPNTGANFYRIKAFDRSGAYSYSSIVKVMLTGTPSINVYPNPVTDGTINIEFTNVAKGTYEVRLINNIGQVIMSRQIVHEEGSSSETIKPDRHVAHGNYELEVISTDNKKFTTKLIY